MHPGLLARAGGDRDAMVDRSEMRYLGGGEDPASLLGGIPLVKAPTGALPHST